MDPAIAHQYAYYAGGYNNYGGAGGNCYFVGNKINEKELNFHPSLVY